MTRDSYFIRSKEEQSGPGYSPVCAGDLTALAWFTWDLGKDDPEARPEVLGPTAIESGIKTSRAKTSCFAHVWFPGRQKTDRNQNYMKAVRGK
jgi:hypothetical protein